MESVTSAANPLVKELRRATGRGSLTSEGLCIAESVHLLEEALRSGCQVPAILLAESAQSKGRAFHAARMLILPDSLFQTITTTEASQGVIALVKPPAWPLDR